MRQLIIASTLLCAGCATKQLQQTARAAVVIEKSSAAGIRTINSWAQDERSRCSALDLQTQAERAECIDKALKAVKTTAAAAEQLKLTLENFWSVYAVIVSKQEYGMLRPEDLNKLFEIFQRLTKQYNTLKPHLKEIGE